MIKRFFRLILFCIIMLLLTPIASVATLIEGTILIPLWYVFSGKWHYVDYASSFQRLCEWAYKLIK